MALPTFNGWNITTLPNSKFQSIDFVGTDTIGMFTSKYTNQTQTYDWQSSYLSGTVTLPPQTAATASAWVGFLLSCRGGANVFVLGDSSQQSPFGAGAVNLVPDSGLNFGFTYWNQPSTAWSISVGGGLNGANAFLVSSAESAAGNYYTTSARMNLVAGQTYTISGYIDSTNVSAGNPSVSAYDPAISVSYGGVFGSPGEKGVYSFAFSFNPVGVATGQTAPVVFLFDTSDATFTQLLFSSPMVQVGSVATSYVQTPYVDGAGQTGYSLVTDGWTASTSGLLLPGDYITIMSAPINTGDISIPRLYRITQPVSSDSGGNATLSIWPQIRETPATGTSIITSNTTGLFRLAQAHVNWHKSYDTTMQASFQITEAM